MKDDKHFLAGIMGVILGDIRIIILQAQDQENANPPVTRFVKLIGAVKYKDGCYHTYYNELKEVMEKFIIYWRETMDDAVKRAECLYHKELEKEILVLHIVNAVRLIKDYEKYFFKEFSPIESAQEQRIYDDLKNKFKNYANKLHDAKLQVEAMDHHDKVTAFAHEQIEKAIDLKRRIFVYTHTYISMLLADRLPEIRGSLKEILNRQRNNLKQLEVERESNLNDLLHQLYEKHKDLLQLRRDLCSETEIIEMTTSIDKTQTLVKGSGNHEAIWQVTQDIETTERRYAEFERIATNLNTLKDELEKTYREEAIYNSRTTMELPGSKFKCWKEMGKKFAERKEYLMQQLINAAKSLATFFVVRGSNFNSMTYHTDAGMYSVDFYGHLITHFNNGLYITHQDCAGQHKMVNHKDADYFDENGRFLLKNDQKLYQVADCTSLYKIGEDTLLKKVTTDCGHSEVTKTDCAVNVKDLTVDVILPKTEPVDINRTLNAEVVKYLWDAFGAILPDALYEVCQLRPLNPIHRLAHILLKHKHSKTPAEWRQKAAEAEAYRENIYKGRKEKAVAESLAWKAKQVKRRKPEESDDSFNRAVYDIHVATNEFIKSLDYYN